MTVEDFSEKVAAVRPKLLKIATQSIHNSEEAEDVVQETFLRLWAAQTKGDRYENWEAAAVKTLKNGIIDEFRRRKNKENESIEEYEAVLSSNFNNPHQQLEGLEKWQILQHIINQLPHLQQSIITLKDIDGYETEDIAKITQSSIDSVRMNLSRARKKVKEIFLQITER
jgi:RNA polymerase sigma-70 factor (ECF subfamily)